MKTKEIKMKSSPNVEEKHWLSDLGFCIHKWKFLRTEKGEYKTVDVCECEVCGNFVSDVYYLVQMRVYFNKFKNKKSLTEHGCNSIFGHKECITSLT